MHIYGYCRGPAELVRWLYRDAYSKALYIANEITLGTISTSITITHLPYGSTIYVRSKVPIPYNIDPRLYIIK